VGWVFDGGEVEEHPPSTAAYPPEALAAAAYPPAKAPPSTYSCLPALDLQLPTRPSPSLAAAALFLAAASSEPLFILAVGAFWSLRFLLASTPRF
jgi:hypothetical protein